MSTEPQYQRILLKMSGEALSSDNELSIDPHVIDRMASEIAEVHNLGVEVAVVVGGGNFFRGAQLSKLGIHRMTGDYMGMLATLMNALALRDALERIKIKARILSALPMTGIVDPFDRRKAIAHLADKEIVIFAAGTGNPLVTTDTAASLRGIEIEADAVLKATNVDGIYDKDPRKHNDAKRYDKISYVDVLEKELAVMDLAAFCQCRDYDMTLRVFDFTKAGALKNVVMGADEGTTVTN